MEKNNKALLDATFEIMEELLQTEDVYEILSRCLDIMASTLKCDAAVAWIANKSMDRLYPLFHMGPSDIGGISVPVSNNSEGQCFTGGVMLFNDRDYSHLSEKLLTDYRRDKVGFIFQSYNLMPNLTAKENLGFIAELVPAPMSSEEALEKVGMSQRADHFPSQLSGGQQQRIAIARALVKKPRIILADEPTAALDLDTSLDVLEAIQEIVLNGSATVIIVTHNAEIAKISDRVIKLRNGRIASIKTNPNPKSARELIW